MLGGLLEEAKEEVKAETVAMNLPKGSVVRRVMEFLSDLDDDQAFKEMNAFEEQCLPKFEGDEEQKTENYRLEYYDLHKEFCDILEAKLEGFVERQG